VRLRFVSHSLPPVGRPLANLGGMQRVALKLHETLAARAEHDAALTYDSLLLRSSWRWVHLRTPLFLARAAGSIVRSVRRDEVDVLLFSSMVTAALAVPLQGLLRRHGVRTAAIVHGLDVTTPFGPYQWFVPAVFDATLDPDRLRDALGIDETEALDRVRNLRERGIFRRFGAVLNPPVIGSSTLAAVSAPEDRFDEVDESVEDALTRILSAGFGETTDQSLVADLAGDDETASE